MLSVEWVKLSTPNFVLRFTTGSSGQFASCGLFTWLASGRTSLPPNECPHLRFEPVHVINVFIDWLIDVSTAARFKGPLKNPASWLGKWPQTWYLHCYILAADACILYCRCHWCSIVFSRYYCGLPMTWASIKVPMPPQSFGVCWLVTVSRVFLVRWPVTAVSHTSRQLFDFSPP